MNIKLLTNLPIDTKHGMKEGLIIKVHRENKKLVRGGVVWYVLSPTTGEEVGILPFEAQIVAEKE